MAEERCRVDLLRHGRCAGGGHLLGRSDPDLLAEGWRQMAQAVAGTVDWECVLSSPLQRCRAFAAALAHRLGVPLRVDADWSELDFGAWEGRAAEELGADLARFQADPERHPPPGGEPFAAARARVLAAWQRVLASGATRVLVVTHGGPIRILLSELLGLPWARTWQLRIDPGARSRLLVHPGPPPLVELVEHRGLAP
ncbi:MAG: hypothetical protein KatS3mg124_2503 [Porticoccaceae bacterium]|nr:MAG: hypothetical protein KatS3mg124_2503 [Porticoccaceae bacterium]